MENENKLETGIGTKEAEKLEAKKVKVENVEIRTVKENMEKAVLVVKHPDKDEPIEISAVKYEKDGKLKVTGLWYKSDEDKLIQKGSALAIMLGFYSVNTLKELVGKEVETVLDDKGYLSIKAY